MKNKHLKLEGYHDIYAEAEERLAKDRKRYAKKPPDLRVRDEMDDFVGGYLLTSYKIDEKKRMHLPPAKRSLRVVVDEIEDMDDLQLVHACMESATRMKEQLEDKLSKDTAISGPRLWIGDEIGSVVSGKPRRKHRETPENRADRAQIEAFDNLLVLLEEKQDELINANREFRNAA